MNNARLTIYLLLATVVFMFGITFYQAEVIGQQREELSKVTEMYLAASNNYHTAVRVAAEIEHQFEEVVKSDCKVTPHPLHPSGN